MDMPLLPSSSKLVQQVHSLLYRSDFSDANYFEQLAQWLDDANKVFQKEPSGKHLDYWGAMFSCFFKTEVSFALDTRILNSEVLKKTAASLQTLLETLTMDLSATNWVKDPKLGIPVVLYNIRRLVLPLIDSCSASPTYSYLLHHLQWDPSELLNVLHATKEQQLTEYLSVNSTNNIKFVAPLGWKTETYWLLQKEFCMQTLDTSWVPPHNGHSDGMWYTDPMDNDSGDTLRRATILAKKMPWSFGAALEYYRDAQRFEPTERLIFDMDWSIADPSVSTYTMLELIDKTSWHEHQLFAIDCIKRRSPELLNAFNANLEVLQKCPDLFTKDSVYQSCKEAWKHIVQKESTVSMTVPDSVFECP